jgi:DnaJ-class molecular chaperone
MKTLYQVLQIASDAGPEVVEAAYRALARIYHPDNLQTGNHDRFVEIKQAHEVLTDPQKRAAYDLQLTQRERLMRECGTSHETPGLPIENALLRFAMETVRREVRNIPGASEFLASAAKNTQLRDALHNGLQNLMRRSMGARQ